MIHIKTPATTANLGPGFDSIGMALKLYNNIWVEEIANEKLIIESKNENVPTNNKNMIYRSMEYFYEQVGMGGKLPNIKIIQEDNIPMSRGLGSSAACIVSGILAANELSGLKLAKDKLAYFAANYEGHPDNTTPSLFGGIVVSVLTNEKCEYIKLENEQLKNNLKFAVMVPNFALSTEKARNVLPTSYSREDVVFNISRTALLVAAFATGDFSKISIAVDDKIHQPYRSKIIPNMERIFDYAMKLGAIGVYLSGAGSTLVAITENDDFCKKMNEMLCKLDDNWQINFIEADFLGATLEIV